jgi:hypothetical protein
MWPNRQRIDGIQIASPCSAAWNEMEGDERVRFCGACRLHVYNLSAMDVEEAASLIGDGTSSVCVRLHRRRDGTVLTRDCPVGYRMAVRRKRSVLWGSLALGAGLLGVSGPTFTVRATQVRKVPKSLTLTRPTLGATPKVRYQEVMGDVTLETGRVSSPSGR